MKDKPLRFVKVGASPFVLALAHKEPGLILIGEDGKEIGRIVVTSATQSILPCQHCGKPIMTGFGTGRKCHSKFCDTRCRVAHKRAKDKAEKENNHA